MSEQHVTNIELSRAIMLCLKKGIPFELRLPSTKPTAIGGMSREQLDAELMKGVESMKSGKTYTADEVDAELKREFGI